MFSVCFFLKIWYYCGIISNVLPKGITEVFSCKVLYPLYGDFSRFIMSVYIW